MEILAYAVSSLVSLLVTMFYFGQKTKSYEMTLNHLDERLVKVESLAHLATDVITTKDRLNRLEVAIEKHLDGIRSDLKDLGNEIKQILRAHNE
jgi:hypothetical protein